MTNTKIYKKMKHKSLLTIENIIKREKTPYYNYKKLFSFRKSGFSSASIFQRV